MTKPAAIALPLPERIAVSRQALLRAALLAGICLLPILIYIPVFVEPLHNDEGTYATVAQTMLDGGLPFRDAFDVKPIMIYLWYALSFLLFGEHIWAPRLLAALFLSLTTLLVFIQARLLFSRRSAYVGAFLFALSTGILAFWPSAQAEHFMLLPMVGALLCFTLGWQQGHLRWHFLAGLLSGVAILTKQSAAFNFLALVAFAFLVRPQYSAAARVRWRPPAALMGGASIILASSVVPFVILGAFNDLFYASFEYLWLHAESASWGERLYRAWSAIIRISIAAGPWVIFSVLGTLRLLRGRGGLSGLLLVAWSIGSLLGVAANGLFRPYYSVQLLPAMALLFASAMEDIWPLLRRFRERSVVSSTTTIGFVMTVFAFMLAVGVSLPAYTEISPEERQEIKYGDQGKIEAQSPLLAAYIEQRTAPGEPIYVIGYDDQLYFYADRPPAVPWLHFAPLSLDEGVLEDALRELSNAPPVYIIDSARPGLADDLVDFSYPTRLAEFLSQHYDYLGRVYFADIWRLKGR